MGSGNAKFLVGLGIGSAIGALVYHAELAVVEAKDKAVKAGAKVAGKVADKATEVKEKLTPNS